jgi:membrane protein DedA with SNARE-associated domain
VTTWVSSLLEALLGATTPLVYLVLAAFAAGENFFPPLPADVVILVGAFLARRDAGSLWLTFLVVWAANVGGALLVYAAGRSWGPAFFAGRLGRYILRPGQIARLEILYRRRGFMVIFLSRLLPMFRSVVPVFAGISGIGLWRTFVPVAAASALWYGCIVVIGSVAADNLERLLLAFDLFGRALFLFAAMLAAVIGWLWWRTRAER